MSDASGDLIIKHELVGDEECTLRVSGSLDLNTCAQLEEVLKDLLRKGCRQVTMDLSGLEYISSAGFGVFIQETQEYKAENGNILFVNPSDKARDMFELLGILLENCRFE